jgi:hypothetical protein
MGPRAHRYHGLPELTYPFHDRDVVITACGRLCLHRKKINISTVLAGQKLGIRSRGPDLLRSSSDAFGGIGQGPPAHQASAYAAITQSGSSADVVFAAAAISHANVSIARSSAWASSHSGAEALTAPRD